MNDPYKIDRIQIDESIIDLVGSTFKKGKQPKTVKTRPCRIKFNGELITTNSNKTIWRNKGFAKSALLNHLYGSGRMDKAIQEIVGSPYFNKEILKNLIKDLEAAGIIQYVEVEIEDFAVSKRT